MNTRSRVVEYLWRVGPVPRTQVVRETELSRATVSRLVGELRAQGVVVERRTPASGPRSSGRPPALLAIEPRLGSVGGIDFGHGSVRVAIAGLDGALVAERRYELDVDNAPARSIALAVDGLRRLAGGDPLLAVGAAISAPVKRDTGTVMAAGILPGWRGVSLGDELRARLGVPVHVGNDANLGALAEVRAGAGRGARNVVYLMLSSGIGSGLVLGGELYTGCSGMTGELGHVVVEPDGEPCRCGHRGCLETVAGAERLRARLGSDIAIGEAAERARAGHARWQAAFADAGEAVGRVTGALCNFVNPELVIVGGDLIVAGDAIVAGVRAGLRQTAIEAVRADVRVVAAQLGDRAELLGAVGLALGEVDVTGLVARAAA